MMRVLHLPFSVGGNPIGLAEGECDLGIHSEVLTFSDRENKLKKLLLRLQAFYNVRGHFDVYHFNSGSSLLHAPQYGLNLFDLPFYPSAAKKIMTFQGCDARQKYPTIKRLRAKNCDFAGCFEADCYQGVCNSGQRDKQRRKTIEKADRHIDHFFALNPDLLHFLPKGKSSFLPYSIGGFSEIQLKTASFFKDDKITIVHAPTQRAAKGTRYILQAIEKLQDDFPGKINFKVVENLSWESALSAYREADLFIDQVLIGWYGAVAVEVMKMGIPVACYINQDDLHFVPEKMQQALPLINLNKSNCYAVLKDMITNRERLPQLGKQSLAYVNEWHDPTRVAAITLDVYGALQA